MTTPAQPQPSIGGTPMKRIRINVSTSVKGVKTWDAAVELLRPEGQMLLTQDAEGNDTLQPLYMDLITEALAESGRLVAELDRLYPKEV